MFNTKPRVQGGIANRISWSNSFGRCFCASENTVVAFPTWRCLCHSKSAIYLQGAPESTTYLLINVITSVSSMVFRPACLEYVARSSLACSKNHSEACSTAARTSLPIFGLPLEPVRANLAASFLTTPDGKFGTGIPCREIFFSLRGRARRASGKPDGVASLSDTLSLSSMPKPPPTASSDETEGGPGSIASSAKSSSSSFPIPSPGPAVPGWSGVGKEKSRLNRRRSSVSPLYVH